MVRRHKNSAILVCLKPKLVPMILRCYMQILCYCNFEFVCFTTLLPADAYVRKKSLQKLSIDDATSMGQPHAKRACLLRAVSGDSYSLQQSKTLFGRVALPWLQVPRRKDRQVGA